MSEEACDIPQLHPEHLGQRETPGDHQQEKFYQLRTRTNKVN